MLFRSVTGTLQVRAAQFTNNYPTTNTITIGTTCTVEYAATNSDQFISPRFTYGTLRISGTNTTKFLTTNLPIFAATTATVGNLYIASGILDLGTNLLNRGSTVAGGTLTIINSARLRVGGTTNFPANVTPAPSQTPP